MLFNELITVLSSASVALAAASGLKARVLATHHSRGSAPSSFVSKGAANPDALLDLKLGLTPANRAGLEQELLDISTPGSSKYGQHLSLDQVKKYMTPTPEATSSVLQWLTEQGINGTTNGAYDDWVHISIPVAQANQLLEANFSTYVHSATGVQKIRTLSYKLPSDLFQHIKVVHPTTAFVAPLQGRPIFSVSQSKESKKEKRMKPRYYARQTPADCNTEVTPSCLQSLYGIPTAPATQSSNSIAVSGFLDQFAQKSDLTSFLKQFRPDIPSSTTFKVATLDGGSDPQSAKKAGVEANLDIQYTVGIATKVPTIFVSVGDQNKDGAEGFLDIIQALSNADAPPQVLTTSYGFNELALSAQMEQKMCDSYMALGARGVSVLFASGDGGTAGSRTQKCTEFVPSFPSTCPYLTSVGATQGISPEVAAKFSSGGFSNVFGRPDYQTDAVSGFLKQLGDKNANLFNSSGRGFPDVAAQGVAVQIVNGGKTEAVEGTSCSSPIFASMIALINDQLIAAGKSPLGFLNPFLYKNPQMFTDITQGSNSGCADQSGKVGQGFQAVKGWDPVTGLGTPIFNAMVKAAGL